MDPELFAQIFGANLFGASPAAAAGAVPALPVAPAPELVGETLSRPPARPVEPYMSEPYAQTPPTVPQSASLGQALEPGTPLPRPRPPGAPTAAEAAAATPSGGDRLLAALRGVQAPKPPEAQKVSTPHAPQLRPIQGGQLFDLLATLGLGPQQMTQGLKLPSTLGQALGTGGR